MSGLPLQATGVQRAQDAVSKSAHGAVYRKVALRLMPFLLLCYIANYIDRTNVSIAQIHLRSELGFSDQIYGIGVGLFFLGFILFEIPSNLILARFGARLTLFRIMVLWGAVSALTMFVRTPYEFYFARLLLGIAEAGFFPGILLYMTYWIPSSLRTRFTAIFFLGIPLAGIIGSPLSGWIISSLDGAAGYRGWQWLFLLEGLPAVILGVLAYFVLDDSPATARWLTPDEKLLIESGLAAEREAGRKLAPHASLLMALKDPRIYILGLVGCGSYTLANAVSFWSPLIIHASGVKNVLDVGLLAGLPPLVGIVAMLVVGWHSDKVRERRWHAAAAELIASASLIALSYTVGHPYLTLALIAVMTAGHYSGLTVFWSIPSLYLSDSTKAGGIAITTAMGSTAAALSPVLLGWIKVNTGSLSAGLQISAAIISLAAVLLLIFIPRRLLKERAL